nr:MAG TPA: hypothetical protein [Caudoviricetes sp.]
MPCTIGKDKGVPEKKRRLQKRLRLPLYLSFMPKV